MKLPLVLLYVLLMSYDVSCKKNDSFGSATNVEKTDDDFLKVQLQAIKEYKRKSHGRDWGCSYEEHVESIKTIPEITPSQMIKYFDLLEKGLKGDGQTTIIGASSVASSKIQEFDIILIWENMFVNSLEYYNVLYGGKRTYHVGLGTPVPSFFYDTSDEQLLYFDLVSCVPYPDWILTNMNHRVRHMLRVSKASHRRLRNNVNGVAGLVSTHESSTLENLPSAITSSSITNVWMETTLPSHAYPNSSIAERD